jgi:amino acid transporter
VARTGGPYAYVEEAFGPYMGYMTGVMTWMLGITAFAAVANVFIDSLGATIPAVGTPTGRVAGLVLAFAVLALVNIRGVQHGNRLNTTMIVVKTLPLLVFVIGGALAIEPSHLQVEALPAPATIARTSIVLLFAFTGVESALVVSGELRDPARTVPRGILIGMAGVTVLYISIQLVAQGVLGPALGGTKTPLVTAAEVALGGWGRQLLLLGVVVSTFGYLSGMALASPRSLFALARDGFLPRVVAAVHPRYHTPAVAVLLQLGLTCLLAVTSSFGALAVISNVAALLCYLACAAAAWRLRTTGVRVDATTPFQLPGGGLVPILTAVAIVALLTSITASEWIILLEVATVATVIFLVTRSRRAARPSVT